MLSDNYIRAINANYDVLLVDLIVDDIVPDLRSCESFTISDEEIIQHKVTSKDKNKTLLDIIKSKDNTCFEMFRDILSETSPHLADLLCLSINNKRTRRYSESEFGNILICGGVPDRMSDYVVRKSIEDEILIELKSAQPKPILVHGEAGCGKSSVVSNVLHSEGLFPQRYTKVCWMSIGNIKETEVLRTLMILSAKLDSNEPDPNYPIPELYKELISKKLRNQSVLLILDDIWNIDIMKYFMFPVKYLVTSRNSALLTTGQAVIIEVPRCFTDRECSDFLNDCIDKDNPDLVRKLIELSHGNPMCLSGFKNLLNSNKDYIDKMDNTDVVHEIMQNILKVNIEILDEDKQRCYKLLSILKEDETVSVNLLSIYWNISEAESLKYINFLYDNHLISKKWIEEYKCNMYGIHDTHSDYLHSAFKKEIVNYQNVFIDHIKNKYPDWLIFDHRDPCFFNNCARFLTSTKDIDTLRRLFTDFTFLASKIVVGGIMDLLFDYDTYRPTEKYELWDQFNTFFMRHNHRFVQFTDTKLKIQIGKTFATIIQLALFEDQSSDIFKIAIKSSDKSNRKDFWIWHNPVPSMKIWEARSPEVIALIDINHRGILSVTENDILSLYEIKTGKCLFNYKIFSEIVLCKFLNTKSLEFFVMVKAGKISFFDVSNLLDETKEHPKNAYDDDDLDFVDDGNASGDLEVDFNSLRKKFLRCISSNFTKKCEISKDLKLVKYNKSRHYVTGFIDCGTLFIASIGDNNEPSIESTIETLIECYSMDRFHLKTSFKVPYSVKKIIHNKTEDGKEFQVYILSENSSSVDFYDEDGNKIESFSIENCIIMDFIISDRNIYMAISNKVYKNRELTPLISINEKVNIQRLSTCHDQSLMALCLTNKSVQIWNIADKKLLYSVKGFDFSDAQFECCNHMITTEKCNIAKWSMDHLKNASGGNKSKQHVSYRSFFHMCYQNPSSITLIAQQCNDNLEFLKLDNNEYNSKVVSTTSKATCFAVEGNYAFIGFVSSHLRVYDLTDFSVKAVIEGVNNVKQLMVWPMDGSHWDIVVNCGDSNQLKSFRLSIPDGSIVIESPERNWPPLTKLKIFKTLTNNVMIGVYGNPDYDLYRLSDKLELQQLFSKSFNNLIDFDVNDNGEYFCASNSNGVLEVWNSDESYERTHRSDMNNVLRMCKFRPTNAAEPGWNVIAYVNDDGEVVLIYFNKHEYRKITIIEDNPPSTFEILFTMMWTNDGNYLLVAENDIRKWKVPLTPQTKDRIKLPLTKFYTYSGGIRCLFAVDNFICSIDRGGYLYVLKKM